VDRLEERRIEVTKKYQNRKPYDDALVAYRDFMSENRVITNHRGQTASLKDACCPPDKDIPTAGQMGACAAPKLLAEALRCKLIPVGLAEFWYGKDTDGRKHKTKYQSCQYCRSILGFALCGLDEVQMKLDRALAQRQ
jgi:hypothetical protein